MVAEAVQNDVCCSSASDADQAGVSERDDFVLDSLTAFDLVDGPKCGHFPVGRHATERVQLADKGQRNGMVDEIIATDAAAMQGQQVTVEAADNGDEIAGILDNRGEIGSSCRIRFGEKSSHSDLQHIHSCQPRPERFRDTGLTPIRPGQLPTDRTRGVGVVAQINRLQHSFLERRGIVEGPQRRLQTLDHPPRSLNLRWLLLAKTSQSNLLNQRMQRLDVVELLQPFPIRRQNLITVFAVYQCGENRCQIPAG